MVDHVKKTDGFTLEQLSNLMGNIDSQPDWRGPAAIACAYYDGDQLSDRVREVLQERGQPEIVHNMIGPTIDGVLGLEAKTRSDLMVSSDDAGGEEMALGINEKFKDSWRLANADRACSDAYAGQIKAGIGWVEITRNPIPFAAEFRVKNVHRRNIWWDWHATEIDKSDARWLLHKKWMDFDEALATFPDHKEVLENTTNQWEDFANTEDLETQSPDLHAAWHDYDSWDRKQSDWMDTQRKRVLLQVVYYKTWQRAHVMKLSDGRVIEFDKNNPVHQAAVESGKVKLSYAAFPKVREAWFVGPHRIVDRSCDAPDGMYPLVPFIGYQKDSSGEPYGLISRMIPAQDGINTRVMRLNFLLLARRIIADEDATNLSTRRLKEEIEKPDGYVPLNPDRKNKNKSINESFTVQNDIGIAAQQFSLMQNDMKLIQDTAGVYNSMLGQDSNASSGVAIANLVEQGTTTLAEVNDNFHYSRGKVADLLLAYKIQDYLDQENVQVTVNRNDKARKKEIVLNQIDGNGKRTNDISRFRGHIALMPIASTPTYKQQQAQLLTQAIGKIPPEAQSAVVPMLIELLDVPNKQEVLDSVRQALNIPKNPDDMTEKEQQAFAEQQQQAQQKAEQQEQFQMKGIQIELEKQQLENDLIGVKIQELSKRAETEDVKDDKLIAETEQLLQEIEAKKAETAALRHGMTTSIQSQLDSIQV